MFSDARVRSTWLGEHDLEILRMSSIFPANLDAQPLQVQKRLAEMFSPLLSAMQQRDTEAQRLQTQQEKKVELQEKENSDMASASKDSRVQPLNHSLSVCLARPEWLSST